MRVISWLMDKLSPFAVLFSYFYPNVNFCLQLLPHRSKFNIQNIAYGKQQMNTLLIKNGRVIDPANNIDKSSDILVENGKIKQVAAEISAAADETIDATGQLVTPGLIDIHVHFRQPGFEDKETIKTGCRAAAAGGFTTIVTMPNTNPVIDSMADVYNIYHIARDRAIVNVFTTAAVTENLAGEKIAEFGDLIRAGAVAFTDDGLPVWDSSIMRRALEYTSMFNVPIMQHCEDLKLSGGHVMHAGEVSAKLGLPGYPSTAEAVIIARDIELAAMTGGHLHVQHVSARRSVELIRDGKARGVKVTAEASPHHIALTHEALLDFNTNAKMNPPLRTEDDRQALIEGLREGVLDCVATDHAPHTDMEKDLPFINAPNGVIGLENSFATCNTYMVEKGLLDLKTLIARMTCDAAKILDWDKGTLSEGSDADITILDLNEERVIDKKTYYGKSKNSPFLGMTQKGWPTHTIVGGEIVFNKGEITKLSHV